MAITHEWKVQNMERNTSDGGVSQVWWAYTCSDPDHKGCILSRQGRLRFSPDADSDGFIVYESLTESTVLGWVYNELAQEMSEGDNQLTAAEAKQAMEDLGESKVNAKIDRKTSKASGKPW